MLAQAAPDAAPAPRSPLVRILGLGFGLAVTFGGTVGVGILRLPGTIAAELPNFWLIQFVWIAGGIYAMLGAISIDELGAALPVAGGFYVYARRAFGPGVSFAVGWADWLSNCAVVAYATVTITEYLVALAPGLSSFQTAVSLSILSLFCILQTLGLRLSSSIQKVTSSVTALTFLLLAGACLLHPSPTPAAHSGLHPGSFHLLALVVAAFRAIVVAYDGWYEAIYFTEEDTNAQRHLPRAMIGGVATILGLFLLLNLAFLHVLQVPALAASKLPAADAAQIVFHSIGGRFVTILAVLTLFSLVNAVLLGAPRILLAIGRDGLFTRRATQVGRAGTPVVALLISAAAAAFLIVTGRFEDIIAIAAILVTALYSISFIAVLTLRVREPGLARPFRAWGYPFTTLVVLLGSLAFLAAAIHDDPTSALRVLALVAIAVPVYFWVRWRQRSSRPA
jgi:APA family basic amino acid/polyamine antiporter